MRILLVDDDETLMDTLAKSLIEQRYAVDIATTGEMAHEFLALFAYDLIVLDVLLPDVGGISLCQQLRQEGISCPILMLTAKDDSTDKVHALDAGADDYVVKPFDFEELCARIRALLRRDSHTPKSVLEWERLRLYPDTFEVFYGDHQLHTTPKEYALLELFLRHPNRVFSLDAIIENLWSFEDPPSGDAVRTHIKGLRQKLKAGSAPKDFIETVYGLGYRLKPLESAVPDSPHLPVPEPPAPTKAEIAAAVAEAWNAHRETMQERLSVLEATAAALVDGQLSAELHHAGRTQAHKLAGSLGCFGFSEGSRLARELEDLLQLDAPFEDRQASQFSTLVQHLRQTLNDDSRDRITAATVDNGPQLLVVGVDDRLHAQLVTAAVDVGMQLSAAVSPAVAQSMLKASAPAEVLLQIDEANFQDAMQLLDAIAQRPTALPSLILTDIQDFHQRLDMVQRGADRILPASTAAHHVIEVIQETLSIHQAAFKLLIVDDDSQVLDLLRTILTPWGFQLTMLNDPTQLWETLETVQPHLLVLDVEMPEETGLELCQVLRADDRWRQLPVLFLTIHEDAHTQQQAFNVGADDFIRKSAMAAELPVRIMNRLKRSHP